MKYEIKDGWVTVNRMAFRLSSINGVYGGIEKRRTSDAFTIECLLLINSKQYCISGDAVECSKDKITAFWHKMQKDIITGASANNSMDTETVSGDLKEWLQL